jgi:hypothetical protein
MARSVLRRKGWENFEERLNVLEQSLDLTSLSSEQISALDRLRKLIKPQTLTPSPADFGNSGIVSPGECLTLSISEYPSDAVASSLSDILETGVVPRRYFLSAKACLGILRRAAKRGKELPKMLEEALKAAAGIPPHSQIVEGAGEQQPPRGPGQLRSSADLRERERERVVTHSLTKRMDSSEDGTGRGTPLIVDP